MNLASGENGTYRLVVLSRCLPYEGIDHAGGEYVVREIIALKKFAEIAVVAVDAPRERRVVERNDLPYRAVVIKWSGIYGHSIYNFVRRVQNKLFPLSLPFGLGRSIDQCEELIELCKEADVVEVQWTEMACVWRRLAASVGPKKTVIVAHDVVSQRHERQMRHARGITRLFWWLVLIGVRSRERKILTDAGTVVVFSDKDASLIRSLGVSGEVRTIPPPLQVPARSVARDPAPATALFVANFQRLENRDAADWLLREIWPAVRRRVPDAALILGGAGSDSYLAERSGTELTCGVESTGYLQSLDELYRRATVAVVPVRLGAGVKFKTLSAMLWGVPIVSTPQGTEGLAPDEFYVGVTGDGRRFAGCVVDAMLNPSSALVIAERARLWAESHTASSDFAEKLLKVHGV